VARLEANEVGELLGTETRRRTLTAQECGQLLYTDASLREDLRQAQEDLQAAKAILLRWYGHHRSRRLRLVFETKAWLRKVIAGWDG